MTYTLEEQLTTDLDWFGTDLCGHIGHFATDGYILPPYIACSKEQNEKLISYFKHLANIGKFEVNRKISDMHQMVSNAAFDRFIVSFGEMSSKGICSFHKLPSSMDDGKYYLVTKPEVILTVDQLPKDISSLLLSNQINANFISDEFIDVNDTVSI